MAPAKPTEAINSGGSSSGDLRIRRWLVFHQPFDHNDAGQVRIYKLHIGTFENGRYLKNRKDDAMYGIHRVRQGYLSA